MDINLGCAVLAGSRCFRGFWSVGAQSLGQEVERHGLLVSVAVAQTLTEEVFQSLRARALFGDEIAYEGGETFVGHLARATGDGIVDEFSRIVSHCRLSLSTYCARLTSTSYSHLSLMNCSQYGLTACFTPSSSSTQTCAPRRWSSR